MQSNEKPTHKSDPLDTATHFAPKIEMIHPSLLKAHPQNALIYGPLPQMEDFQENVRRNGITAPIRCAEDGTIIDGHRRWTAATLNGFKEVPVIRLKVADTNASILALLDANDQREKSNETRAREYRARKEVEAARAKARQSANAADGVPLADQHKGKAREKAAEKVGLSHKTAEDALKVVDLIDSLMADNDENAADELRDRLKKSVNGALKHAKEQGFLPNDSTSSGKSSGKVRKATAPRKAQNHEEALNYLEAATTFLRDAAPDGDMDTAKPNWRKRFSEFKAAVEKQKLSA